MTALKVLLYLRRFLIEGIVAFSLTSLVVFVYAPDILGFMKTYLNQELAFYGVFEPMVSLIKISAVTAALILAPWFAMRLSQALRVVFGFTPWFSIIFLMSSIVLFFTGVFFCFFVTLPFGIDFLLQFGSKEVQPIIAVGKFVNFVGFFMLGFGVIFELPLVMIVLTKTGVVTPDFFSKYRRYAVLVVAIVAAALTPTPDVFNMALMGIPLYLLYEMGILISKLLNPS
ncbi:Twin-arginine translocation protein TatC [Dissulfuribacter thermophilus]|uniref:Sec-independent protein translocase protein TatC n=1 Tax=Dissulfuribacter thermophilus TaxID=1156395 RepID=A0A1B9F7P9_9BACT|nr:twin-arginine translocase subunit TatC [Dissulfuribacter thermophilus]OCC15920.1 Twin-arginine translocation protein TatC [Dissulfuribacter thermophilus]